MYWSTQDDDAPFHAYREIRTFGSLDGLRFICIAMVLWHHGVIWTALPDPPMILKRGFSGVDFFFVLSGFLITTLLLREESRAGRFSILAFYHRRILRIVPVYFLAITLISCWWILVRGQTEWLSLMPYYYFFLSNFLVDGVDIPLLSPMWSLAVEEQYYLVWPAILLLLRWQSVRIGLLIALISVFMLSAQGVLPAIEPVGPTQHASFVLPTGSYQAILIGALISMALHHPTGFKALWRVVGFRWVSVALFASIAVALQFLPSVLPGWPNLILHSLMGLAVASLVVREDHAAAPVLRARPVARIGKISYGLYIWHLVGLHIGNEIGARLGWTTSLSGAWGIMVLYITAGVVIAELSYRYFESYFLELKKRSAKAD